MRETGERESLLAEGLIVLSDLFVGSKTFAESWQGLRGPRCTMRTAKMFVPGGTLVLSSYHTRVYDRPREYLLFS